VSHANERRGLVSLSWTVEFVGELCKLSVTRGQCDDKPTVTSVPSLRWNSMHLLAKG